MGRAAGALILVLLIGVGGSAWAQPLVVSPGPPLVVSPADVDPAPGALAAALDAAPGIVAGSPAWNGAWRGFRFLETAPLGPWVSRAPAVVNGDVVTLDTGDVPVGSSSFGGVLSPVLCAPGVGATPSVFTITARLDIAPMSYGDFELGLAILTPITAAAPALQQATYTVHRSALGTYEFGANTDIDGPTITYPDTITPPPVSLLFTAVIDKQAGTISASIADAVDPTFVWFAPGPLPAPLTENLHVGLFATAHSAEGVDGALVVPTRTAGTWSGVTISPAASAVTYTAGPSALSYQGTAYADTFELAPVGPPGTIVASEILDQPGAVFLSETFDAPLPVTAPGATVLFDGSRTANAALVDLGGGHRATVYTALPLEAFQRYLDRELVGGGSGPYPSGPYPSGPYPSAKLDVWVPALLTAPACGASYVAAVAPRPPTVSILTLTEAVDVGADALLSLLIAGPSSPALQLQVDWGDQVVDTITLPAGMVELSHPYVDAGVYGLTVDVTGPSGETARAEASVRVLAVGDHGAQVVGQVGSTAVYVDAYLPPRIARRVTRKLTGHGGVTRKLDKAMKLVAKGKLNRALRKIRAAERKLDAARRPLRHPKPCRPGRTCIDPAARQVVDTMLDETARQLQRLTIEVCADGASWPKCPPPETGVGCQAASARRYTPCDDADPATALSICVDGVCQGIADVDADGILDSRDCVLGTRVVTTSLVEPGVLVDGVPLASARPVGGTHRITITDGGVPVTAFTWDCGVAPLHLGQVRVERAFGPGSAMVTTAGLALQAARDEEQRSPVLGGAVVTDVCVADVPIALEGVESFLAGRTDDCTGPDEMLVPCAATPPAPAATGPGCTLEDGGTRVRITGLSHSWHCFCEAGASCMCGALPASACAADPLFFTDADGDGWTWCMGDCDDSPATGSGVNPGATEVCDGVDNDCSFAADKDAIAAELDACYDQANPIGIVLCVTLVQMQLLAEEIDATSYADGTPVADDNPCTMDLCIGGKNAPYLEGTACEVTVAVSPVLTLSGQCSASAACCVAEVCDGLDNDCDGLVDEDYPSIGALCDGPDADVCAAGTLVCSASGLGAICVGDDGAAQCPQDASTIDFCVADAGCQHVAPGADLATLSQAMRDLRASVGADWSGGATAQDQQAYDELISAMEAIAAQDTTAPVWQGPPSVTERGSTRVTMTWEPATDAGTAVVSYQAQLVADGVVVSSVELGWTATACSFVGLDLSSAAEVSVRVEARDVAGNAAMSPPATWSAALPSWPAGSAIQTVSVNRWTLLISWTEAMPGVPGAPVTQYDVVLNGVVHNVVAAEGRQLET